MLIAAAAGQPAIKEQALALLATPYHEFVYSPLLRLEVLLLPKFNKRHLEVRFYEEYFAAATCYGSLDRIFEIAEKEAYRHGIAVLDATHVATAHLTHCDALITLEKETKPLYRTKLVPVRRLVSRA